MAKTARTRTNDPEAMRRRVLDVAEGAFQARGYHATSLGDLMQAAGVTGGALHHHFPTKKAIGLAVIRERVAAAVEETWIRPVEIAPTAREGVKNVFAAVADQLERQGFVRGCPLNNLAHELSLADPEFRSALADVFASWRRALTDKVQSDQQASRDKTTDPERFAIEVIAAYSGGMALAKTMQDADILRMCDPTAA